jgi:hypothetical protein
MSASRRPAEEIVSLSEIESILDSIRSRAERVVDGISLVLVAQRAHNNMAECSSAFSLSTCL